jgi:recombination protein RecR
VELSSKHIEKAVDQLSTLPGIGKKTALRLALHLLNQTKDDVNAFSNAFKEMKEEVKFCVKCYNVSDSDMCSICTNPKRDEGLICVVEDMRNVIAIENTQQFFGSYHVLGGIISPMDGIGPSDLHIEPLVKRIKEGSVREVIMALSTTMEGDTTNFYLFKRLKEFNVTLSTIARGVAIGDDLEYTDELTLGRSIVNRMPYATSLS